MSKKTHTNSKLNTSAKITAEQTIIIIRLIKKYKSIWDRNHPDFRKRQIRYNTFKKIGSYFQLTAEDVSRKYRRFRNCYIQELKLIRDKKKSYTNLFYFDEMEFLREQVEHRTETNRTSSSMVASDTAHSDFIPETDDDEIPIELLEVDDEYSLEPQEVYELSSNDSIHSNQEPIMKAEEIKEEMSLNLEPDVAEECPVEEMHFEEELNLPPNDKTDEFDIFAGYLASQLREMDKLSALETMEELQRIIFKRRIHILKRKQSSN